MNSEAFFGRATPNAGFDPVDLGDAAQALGGDLGPVFLVNIVQLAPRVRPATRQRQKRSAQAPGFGQGGLPSIAFRRANSPPGIVFLTNAIQTCLPMKALFGRALRRTTRFADGHSAATRAVATIIRKGQLRIITCPLTRFG